MFNVRNHEKNEFIWESIIRIIGDNWIIEWPFTFKKEKSNCW